MIEPHRNDNTKVIFKKKFPYNIGRHGFNGAYFKVLLVVLFKHNGELITPFVRYNWLCGDYIIYIYKSKKK